MSYIEQLGSRILTNPITVRLQHERYFLEVMMWIHMCVCLPLTVLIIYYVCCVMQRSQVPVIYYTNLLLSNLIQMCIMIVWIIRVESTMGVIIHHLCVMAGLYFKVCIALERCFFITLPLLDCLRETRSSVLLCVLVWAFCIVSLPLALVLHQFIHLIIYAALPGALFIFCLARTFRALHAATSVPTQDKRRSLGILILLFFKYCVLIVPVIIFPHEHIRFYINWILFLLCPFVDLVLCLFMRQGRIDRLLACLCSADAAADHRCD
ncbi:uncharacterized protein LOC120443403 [Oreochromis aureus]|uniref:G-protein coupled receptors family 1 profile domain-containing protein n=2 Tax=Oreochromis aureus TaxID=47969 RepID=A0AAZ1X5W7_OREAU|nr:uncharacterized protein LOC120443403 [Oreochromis aureus]